MPSLAPLVGDDPTFMNTPADIAAARAAGSAQQPMNKVIPPELSTMESRLKAQGSGTSWVTTLTAILGAAKGDFRGVNLLEEQKRRTALAKSMVPEITKVNELVNSGKWEEASDHVNQLANSYGQRADYLVPYFQQMQANIQKKQEGWKNLQGIYNLYKDAVTEDNINYPVVQALKKAVESRDQISETTLQGFLTRAAPHLQNIDNRLTATSPLTTRTKVEMLPGVVKGSDMDNFAGNTIGTAYGLIPKQMADLHNGLAVKNSKGNVITPDSAEAQVIKDAYTQLQPINQEIEQAKVLPYEPAVLQQIASKYGRLAAVRRAIPGEALNEAVSEQMERVTEQQRRLTELKLDIDPTALRQMGRVAVHADPSDPKTFLTESTDVVTPGDIKKSNGKLIAPRAETMDKLVRPAQAAMQSLDRIPDLLEGITSKTLGDRLSSGALQSLSSRLGFPLSANVPVIQHAKTILRTAIELVENTPEQVASISGADRVELRDLKAFAAGSFNTPQEVIRAAQAVKLRLTDIIKRAVAVEMPSTAPAGQSESETMQRKAPVKGKSPASAIAPAIPPKGSQVTRQPYTPQGDISIPSEIDADIQKRIADSVRKGEKGGAVRVEVPNTPSGVVQPSQAPQGYSEEDEAAKAMARRQQRRR